MSSSKGSLKIGWFSLVIPVSSTNKTDRHVITEILLKVTLNTINQTLKIGSQVVAKYRFN